MKDFSCEELKKVLASLESQRSNIEYVYDLIEMFVVPFRGKFFNGDDSEEEIEWRKRDKYDDTAVMAAQILSASMQGSLISFATRWFDMRFRKAELNSNDAAKEWLDACVQEIYNALLDSNFNQEASEYFLDLVSFGTGMLIEEAHEDTSGEFAGIDFSAIPTKECYYELDHKDKVTMFFRVLNWTATKIVSKFGEENVPEEVLDDYNTPGRSTNRHKVVFCVYAYDANKNADISSVLSVDARPVRYKYFMYETSEQIGEYGGYYEMPAFISRWRKVSGSKMGYSPAMVALGDILTLNELTMGILEALAKVVDPATLVTERGLMSDLDLGRGGLTVVRNVEDVKSYESKARFDVSELKVERLQQSINRAFHVDQLQLKESPAMTATEVQVRYELMQRLLGPTLGRLENDFLNPLITRTFNILLRAKRLPPIPDVVKESGSEVDIMYTGPLPRSQQREDVMATMRWMGSIAEIAQMYPDAADIPEIDAIIRGLGEMGGVPARFITDENAVKTVREERKQKQNAAEQTALAKAGGEAAQAIGKGAQEISK